MASYLALCKAHCFMQFEHFGLLHRTYLNCFGVINFTFIAMGSACMLCIALKKPQRRKQSYCMQFEYFCSLISVRLSTLCRCVASYLALCKAHCFMQFEHFGLLHRTYLNCFGVINFTFIAMGSACMLCIALKKPQRRKQSYCMQFEYFAP